MTTRLLLAALALLAMSAHAADPLTIGETDATRYGNKWADARPGNEFTFPFDAEARDLTLTAIGYDIDTIEEVSVIVNGQVIGSLPVTPDEDEGPIEIAIPASALVDGANTLVFDHIANSWRWGVRNVLLSYADGEGPSEPPPADPPPTSPAEGSGDTREAVRAAILGMLDLLALENVDAIAFADVSAELETAEKRIAALERGLDEAYPNGWSVADDAGNDCEVYPLP